MDESCAQEYELRFFFGYFQSTVRPVRAKARHAKHRARTHTRRRRKEKMSFTAAASKTTFLAPSLSATTKRTTTRSTSRGGKVGQSKASKGRRCVQVRAGEDVVVSIDELTETTRKAIKTYGYDDKATECILDILMYAQLRGNNQGACRRRGDIRCSQIFSLSSSPFPHVLYLFVLCVCVACD